jgi:hypothetical protein
MLGKAVAVVAGELVDHVAGDGEGPLEVNLVAGHVVRREERLDRVHVRVDAPVGVGALERAVVDVDGHPVGVAPEAPVEDGERVVEDRPGVLVAGRDRGGGGEDDKRVGVSGFGVVRRDGGAALVRRHGRIPAAVLVVAEAAAQRR